MGLNARVLADPQEAFRRAIITSKSGYYDIAAVIYYLNPKRLNKIPTTNQATAAPEYHNVDARTIILNQQEILYCALQMAIVCASRMRRFGDS